MINNEIFYIASNYPFQGELCRLMQGLIRLFKSFEPHDEFWRALLHVYSYQRDNLLRNDEKIAYECLGFKHQHSR